MGLLIATLLAAFYYHYYGWVELVIVLLIALALYAVYWFIVND